MQIKFRLPRFDRRCKKCKGRLWFAKGINKLICAKCDLPKIMGDL